MTDLSHWDFAQHFSGYDAAALILGLEPRESETEQCRVGVVSDRLALHYKYAVELAYHEEIARPIFLTNTKTKANDPQILFSIELERLWKRSAVDCEEAPLAEWLADRRLPKFENQEFDRHSIARWLSAIGMKSVYQFDRSQTQAVETPSGRWPWGDHHTVLLGHLDAAARKFWVNYDPMDATTAPINKEVAEWLVNERKVSQKMAESIASMLRPDDLPTGPRK